MAGTTPGHDEGHTLASSRRVAPELFVYPSPKKRAWGMPDAQAHPQPRVGKSKTTRVSDHGRAGFTRHSRTRMVLTVSFVLAPETGLSCLRRQRNARSIVASLTSASGYQAHTTSPSATVSAKTGRRAWYQSAEA